jgi:hypothetical protein
MSESFTGWLAMCKLPSNIRWSRARIEHLNNLTDTRINEYTNTRVHGHLHGYMNPWIHE